MQVRYNPAVPIVFIVLGAANLVLGLALIQSGGSSFSIILGPLFLLLGLLQLTRTYFEYETHTRTIVVKALIGPMARRFGGAEGSLVVDGNRILWNRADGRVKKVPVSKYMARGDQWRAVISQVAWPHAT